MPDRGHPAIAGEHRPTHTDLGNDDGKRHGAFKRGLAGKAETPQQDRHHGADLEQHDRTRTGPFPGDHEPAVVYSILNEDPAPLTGLRTGIPMELEGTVNRCLEKDSGERYQTAGDLAKDLRRFAEGYPIRARRVGPVERAWTLSSTKWCSFSIYMTPTVTGWPQTAQRPP